MNIRLSSAILGMLTIAGLAITPVRAATSEFNCSTQTLSGSLSEAERADQSLVGQLCSNGDPGGRTVQLLVAGYTYDHGYWDFGYRPDLYSYARYAASSGYAVFMIDRIGTGASSEPPAPAVTVASHAWTIHQVVMALRARLVSGTPFPKVVIVGHSLGSAVAELEASTYHDVNALVVSGWLHTPLWLGTAGVIIGSMPAQLDPRFSTSPLGYLTTVPGSRGSVFHNAADTDPAVIAYDEATKQTGTVGEEATIASTLLPAVTLGIEVPVLLATGQYDSIFCGPLTPCTTSAMVGLREARYFSADACPSFYSLPRSGHDMNLALNARDWYAVATNWLNNVALSEALAAAPGCSAVDSRVSLGP
jgi:pimeloyl-ACP methyl ester carboxylesterase